MTQTKSYPYTVVDVFTTEPLSGNSLAVFPDASEFDAAAMQKIARELNLTETAFVLPATRSDCAARVRIFTPTKELPFAGHPTVGTAFVLLQKGIVSSSCHEFLLEEEFGPIPLRIEAGTPPLIWLRTPAIQEVRRQSLVLVSFASYRVVERTLDRLGVLPALTNHGAQAVS